MLEVGVAQAQNQLTKILGQTTVIVDKKSHKKRAVLIPYKEYDRLIKSSIKKELPNSGLFDDFVGVLSSEFNTGVKGASRS
jgi:hypothetical protein